MGAYEKKLRALQIKLTAMQRHLIDYEHKLLVIFEGRDAPGKDGVSSALPPTGVRAQRGLNRNARPGWQIEGDHESCVANKT